MVSPLQPVYNSIARLVEIAEGSPPKPDDKRDLNRVKNFLRTKELPPLSPKKVNCVKIHPTKSRGVTI